MTAGRMLLTSLVKGFSPDAILRKYAADSGPVSSMSVERSPLGTVASTLGLSYSPIPPLSITRIWSESMIVCKRCAMVSTVQPLSCVRTHSWMAISVSASMDAVASSSTSTRGRRSSARAMHKHWRCPTEKLSPFSVTGASSPPSSDLAKSASCAFSSISQISSSPVAMPVGSTLLRTVVEKSTASCGMMTRLCRSVLRPRVAMSAPSMIMRPSESSTMRNNACMIELLPAPVRPTMPTLLPPGTSKLTLLSTSGRPSR
mmetsp:Transcript_38144/g.82980  ORF Transcript_38144/g.82980 Transcript_38144/m.82980 type:complete len:259 (-) Transcript_38144:3623-4399(-)